MSVALGLPAELQPWQPWLQAFDQEIAATLGDLLLRLDPLLGKGITQVQQSPAIADGYTGTATRGSYERLLLSEWCLAEAMPDEFIRRAVQGEHLFLAPQFQQMRSEPRIVALFDAGPRQWGEPRLVHVAMWILLQRRAQESNAQLLWGLLQRPGELHDASGPDMLLRLLRGRSHECAGPPHWQAWADHLDERLPAAAEQWLLAAGSSAALVLKSSHVVQVRRTFSATLQVTLGPLARPRGLVLPLPASAPSARLLQGRWLQVVQGDRVMSSPSRLSLRQPPQFSRSGRSVVAAFAEGEAHSVCLLRIGDENQRKPPLMRLHRWQKDVRMLCAHVSDKGFGGVVGNSSELRFWQLPGPASMARPPTDELTIHPGNGRWLPAIELVERQGLRHLYTVDNAGRLLCWGRGAGLQGNLQRVADCVVAVHEIQWGGLLYAQYRATEVVLSRYSRHGVSQVIVKLPHVGKLKHVWLKPAPNWNAPLCCVLEQADGKGGRLCGFYRIENGAVVDRQEVHLASGWKVVGLVFDPEGEPAHHLLVIRGDRRALVLVDATGQRLLHQSGRDIATASVSPCGRRAAWVDIDGQLQVMTINGKRLLTLLDGRRRNTHG